MSEMNALPEHSAVMELLKCCGSPAWAHAMASARPFADFDSLCNYGERIWWSLDSADWLDAFHAHPKIGERRPGNGWAAQEQSGMSTAATSTAEALALANEEYLGKFGYIFIVCATGKSAAEMLSIIQTRIHNDRANELRIAATEQSKITRLRLRKLISS